MSTLWLRLGAPWHPLRRAPRPRARHWRPWYLRGRFGTAKTERDATLATIDTVSRVYRIGHQISIRLRPTRGAATRDPSAQPRYHGISPRSLDLPVACARPSDRNSIDSARLRCPRALFVRSPPTIRTLPLLDPSASKSNIESESRGPAIFEIGSGVCAEILPLNTQNLLRKSSTASLAGVTFQPSVVFALFFHLIRDLAHGRRASPLAAGEGQDGERRTSWPGSIPLPSLPRPPHTTTPYLRSCPTTPVACRSPPWFPGSPLALNCGSMRRCSQAWLHRWRLHRSLARALPSPSPAPSSLSTPVCGYLFP